MERSLPVIRPRRLRRGDKIGIIAPASPAADEHTITNGVNYIENHGFRVLLGSSVTKKRGYLAGTDADRVLDIHRMFSDTDVSAIIALRGGYGCARLLPMLDYDLIKRNPKILTGYSDITALQSAIYSRTRLVTFTGPMLGPDFSGDVDPFTELHFWPLLMGDRKILHKIGDGAGMIPVSFSREFTGTLFCGNLSVLCSLLGTPYLPDMTGHVLALEETGEAPYRIDRMLNQLKLCGVFEKLAGLLLGQFTQCRQKKGYPTLKLDEIFDDYFSGVSFPVIKNVPFGHEKRKITLPTGIYVRYRNDDNSLSIVETPVT